MEEKIKNLLHDIYCDNCAEVINSNYELLMVGMKSLILSETKVGAFYNPNKLKQELNLLREYFSADDSVRAVLKSSDLSLVMILLPAIIMNKHWESVVENIVEVFYICDIAFDRFPLVILQASVYFDFLSGLDFFNEDLEVEEEIIRNAKTRLINISIKDIRLTSENINHKVAILKYEQKRINLLASLNSHHIKNTEIFHLMFDNDKEEICISSTEEKMIASFAAYMFKMRNGRINPKLMKYDLDAKATFRGYINSDSFNHPIMGVCEVYKKNNNEIYIKTKIGRIRIKIDEKN